MRRWRSSGAPSPRRSAAWWVCCRSRQGMQVDTDTEIATIEDRSSLLVEFRVPERVAGSIAVGDAVTAVPLARPDLTLEGRIAALDNRIDPDSRTLRVQAALPNADDRLRAGMAFAIEMRLAGRALSRDRRAGDPVGRRRRLRLGRARRPRRARAGAHRPAQRRAGAGGGRARTRRAGGLGRRAAPARRHASCVSSATRREEPAADGAALGLSRATPSVSGRMTVGRDAELTGGGTALFVRRPILAFVLNALIVIAGVAAVFGVEVRELPDVDRPVLTVTTEFDGAAPETIDREITAAIEGAIGAGARREVDLVVVALRPQPGHGRVQRRRRPRRGRDRRARRDRAHPQHAARRRRGPAHRQGRRQRRRGDAHQRDLARPHASPS